MLQQIIRAIVDISVKTYSPPVIEYVLRASSGKLWHVDHLSWWQSIDADFLCV